MTRACTSSQNRKESYKGKERKTFDQKKSRNRYKVDAVKEQVEGSGQDSQSDEDQVWYIKSKDERVPVSVNGAR